MGLLKILQEDVKKMSKNIPDIIKIFFNIFWNTFGIKKGPPARAARTARTPRPIFDDERCSKNISKMFLNVQDNMFLTFLTGFVTKELN